MELVKKDNICRNFKLENKEWNLGRGGENVSQDKKRPPPIDSDQN
jgi:hypothetical protein